MSAPAAAPLLAARGVTRRFGAHVALERVELELAAGDVVALLGPNGAGKSTLLAVLAGALQPTSGAVELRPGARVGWAPQRPAHYGRLSARENLELFAALEDAADPRASAERLLREFGLPPDRPTAELSVGNRQRLNLALALLGEPDVVLLDEPTAALDPAEQRRVLELVEAAAERGAAVVFATQRLDEVDAATRALVLVDGRVVFAGPAAGYAAHAAGALA